ncbi:Uu.00g055830.m01.CDS01 [Anthostomella pinea]|uniref:Uu.00g055830.m01.CDS01 n=1 Tax=Anthostomella pinea TaxID=933095 RepID=A0AAI8VY47_9PEZI|nr:Uu.00g055830.m01.CDS01 [Anthostomella pinea]
MAEKHKETWSAIQGCGRNFWEAVANKPVRLMDSIHIDQEVKDERLEDLTRYLSGRKEFNKTDIPYRRDYLLYDPLGCGKSRYH